MRADDERCAEYEKFRRIDAAFKAGDLKALRAAVEDPAVIPNGPMPMTIGSCLEYAIYHSPLAFVRELLEIGADPNPEGHTGFPPLIAALSCARAVPGAAGRADVADLVRLLLTHGADPDQRGINDFTPLHMSVSVGSAACIDALLEAGADPSLRTRIDECETACEMAERAGLDDIARRLAGTERS
jgi:ankyrin repeat protein